MNDEFWTELEKLIQPVQPLTIEYRLYYDENGNITSCSMNEHKTVDSYVVVTKEIYENYFKYQIVNGVPKLINRDSYRGRQLTPSNNGYLVVKGHAGLIIEDTETYPEIEYYARNN
jgi:hypothetical protein